MEKVAAEIQAVLNDTIKRMIMQQPNAAVQCTPPRNPPEILAADKPSVDPILVQILNETISQISRKPPSPQLSTANIQLSPTNITPCCTSRYVPNSVVAAENLGVDPILVQILNEAIAQICGKPPSPHHPAPDLADTPAGDTPADDTPADFELELDSILDDAPIIDSNVNSNIDASTMADSGDSSDSCDSDIELEEPAEGGVEQHLKEKPDSHSFNLVDDEGSFGTYVCATAAVQPEPDSTAAAAVPTVAVPSVCPPLPSGVSLDQIPPRDTIFNNKCKVNEMKAVLRIMKAPLSGNKAALLARLGALLRPFWTHRGENVSLRALFAFLNI